jgi:hypothetical protein
MSLKCDYEIEGQGKIELSLSEINDLTPEGVETWLMEGAEMDVRDNGFAIRLRPRYTPEQLAEAIKEELAERSDR